MPDFFSKVYYDYKQNCSIEGTIEGIVNHLLNKIGRKQTFDSNMGDVKKLNKQDKSAIHGMVLF